MAKRISKEKTNITEPKSKKKVGRPTDYHEELGDEICLAVSRTTKGLQHLCRENPHWPCVNAIYEWRISHKSFGDKYAKAKAIQADLMVDELIEIADDKSQDLITRTNHDGEEYEVANNEFINRSRVRIDTRKWIAARLAPKFYGDKLQTEVTQTIKTIADVIEFYKTLDEENRLVLIDELSRVHNIENPVS